MSSILSGLPLRQLVDSNWQKIHQPPGPTFFIVHPGCLRELHLLGEISNRDVSYSEAWLNSNQRLTKVGHTKFACLVPIEKSSHLNHGEVA